MIQVRGRDHRLRRPPPDVGGRWPVEAAETGGWYGGAGAAGEGRWAGSGRAAGGRGWAGSIRVGSGLLSAGGGGCRGVGRVGGGVPAGRSPYIQSKSRSSPPAPAGGPLGRSAMGHDATVLL